MPFAARRPRGRAARADAETAARLVPRSRRSREAAAYVHGRPVRGDRERADGAGRARVRVPRGGGAARGGERASPAREPPPIAVNEPAAYSVAPSGDSASVVTDCPRSDSRLSGTAGRRQRGDVVPRRAADRREGAADEERLPVRRERERVHLPVGSGVPARVDAAAGGEMDEVRDRGASDRREAAADVPAARAIRDDRVDGAVDRRERRGVPPATVPRRNRRCTAPPR